MKGQIVASRYAEALFEEASQQNKLDDVVKGLQEFVTLIDKSDDLKVLVKNPLISKADKQSVIEEFTKKGSLDTLLYNFLGILVAKNRLDIIDDIYEAVESMIMDAKGQARVEVTSAVELDEATRKEISEVLEKITGKKVSIEEQVDPEIMGGIVAKVGSNLYDASVKGQVNKLKEKLIS